MAQGIASPSSPSPTPVQQRRVRRRNPMDVPASVKLFALIVLTLVGFASTNLLEIYQLAPKYDVAPAKVETIDWKQLAPYMEHVTRQSIDTLRKEILAYLHSTLYDPIMQTSIDPAQLHTYLVDVILWRSILTFLVPVLIALLLFGEVNVLWQMQGAGWRILLLIPLALALLAPMLFLYQWWAQSVPPPEWLSTTLRDGVSTGIQAFIFIGPEAQSDVWWRIFLAFVVVPAIGEELFWRGAVLRWLYHLRKNAHLAVLITALAFAAVHLRWDGILVYFLMGMILGYLYLWTGTIWGPILIHFLFNGTQFALIYQHVAGHAFLPTSVVHWMDHPGVIGGCALLALILLVLLSRRVPALVHKGAFS